MIFPSSRMMHGWVSNFNPYILDSFDSVMMDGCVIEEAENMKRNYTPTNHFQ
jgi:hypothetical protein